MKKTLLLFVTLFSMISVRCLAQTLIPDPIPSIQVGNSASISFSYTSDVSCTVYAELRIANIDDNNVITQDYSVGSNYISGAFSSLLPSTATSASGNVTVAVPSNAVLSANLPVGKTYSWVFKLTPGINDYSEVGTTYQYTSATIIGTTSVVDNLTLVDPPLTITAGTEVSITVNYTCPAARLVKFGISLYNAGGFVSDLVGTGVDNLPATTTTAVPLTQQLTIPSDAIPSADLPAGQFYKVDTALFTPAFASYILGSSSPVTLNAPLATADFNSSKVKVYPNPATNQITISDVSKINTYEIYNLIGKLVVKSKGMISNTINISTLHSGVYFLKLNEMETLKFVKN